jgi:hypothetical protein
MRKRRGGGGNTSVDKEELTTTASLLTTCYLDWTRSVGPIETVGSTKAQTSIVG